LLAADTLVVDIPGDTPVAGRAICVRIAGCDTPEKRYPRRELRELSPPPANRPCAWPLPAAPSPCATRVATRTFPC